VRCPLSANFFDGRLRTGWVEIPAPPCPALECSIVYSTRKSRQKISRSCRSTESADIGAGKPWEVILEFVLACTGGTAGYSGIDIGYQITEFTNRAIVYNLRN